MIQRAQQAPRRERRPAPRLGPWLAVFGAAVALRALVALVMTPAVAPDPRVAVAARQLASGHGLALGESNPLPTASIPPVAPSLLAMAWRGLPGRPWVEPMLAMLLAACCALAAARLATGLHGPTAGRAAGWMVALSPLLAAGGTLVAPAAFALVMLLASTAGAEWLRTPRRGRAILAGALCGLAGLASLAGLALGPVVLVWSWRPLGLTLPPRERAIQCSLLGLGLLAVLAPWAIRNSVVMRAPVALSTATGVELWSGNNATVWSDPVRRGGTIDVRRVEPYASRLTGVAEPVQDARAWSAALAFLGTRPPGEFAAVLLARVARFGSPRPRPEDPADEARRTVGPVARALGGLEVLWMLLALWGTVRTLSGPRRWFQSLPLVALLAMVAATLPLSGSSTARLGVEPLVAMLAGIGALNARRSLHLRRRGLKLVHGGAGTGRDAR